MPKDSKIVTTDRLILRPFELGDTEDYAAILAQPEVVRFLPGGRERAKRALAIAEDLVRTFVAIWTEAPGYGPWAVIEKDSGALIGHHGLRLLPELDDQTELLYMLDSEVWGRGYASEGALAARDYGFEHLGLERLIALVVPENHASLRVAERTGMRRVKGFIEAFGLELVKYEMDRDLWRQLKDLDR